MTTAFVLTGGGSLGAVQVGMLQALAAHGVRPDLLVGTSAGALNAAWVAGHGLSEESLSGLASVWAGLRRGEVFPADARDLIRGLVGRSRGVTSSRGLRRLVTTHAGIRTFDEARIPVHIVAADVLSGRAVALSVGSLVDAVIASAALPGVFPPVLHRGRYLVDGGVADHTGVTHAVELGADLVYVLPAGSACALPAPPRTAVGMAMHAVSLLIQQRLAREVGDLAGEGPANVRVLPPLCPLEVSAADFGHGAELVDRGRRASLVWIEDGGPELPDPQRFLRLHGHRTPSPPLRDREAPLRRPQLG